MAPEGSIIRNQGPEGEISTTMVVKWSDKVEGSGEKIYAPLCSGLYKEEEGFLVTWSGTDPDTNINCFTCYKGDNDWIVPGYNYNEEFNNWRRHIHNAQFCSQNLNEKRKTEETCIKYTGSVKFNKITREVNPAITTNSYKDKFREWVS